MGQPTCLPTTPTCTLPHPCPALLHPPHLLTHLPTCLPPAPFLTPALLFSTCRPSVQHPNTPNLMPSAHLTHLNSPYVPACLQGLAFVCSSSSLAGEVLCSQAERAVLGLLTHPLHPVRLAVFSLLEGLIRRGVEQVWAAAIKPA